MATVSSTRFDRTKEEGDDADRCESDSQRTAVGGCSGTVQIWGTETRLTRVTDEASAFSSSPLHHTQPCEFSRVPTLPNGANHESGERAKRVRVERTAEGGEGEEGEDELIEYDLYME